MYGYCTCLYGFQYGIVYEYVLVLCLHHVLSLGPETGHVTIDVHLVFILHLLHLCVNHNETTSATNSYTQTQKCNCSYYSADELSFFLFSYLKNTKYHRIEYLLNVGFAFINPNTQSGKSYGTQNFRKQI